MIMRVERKPEGYYVETETEISGESIVQPNDTFRWRTYRGCDVHQSGFSLNPADALGTLISVVLQMCESEKKQAELQAETPF